MICVVENVTRMMLLLHQDRISSFGDSFPLMLGLTFPFF
ncbi:hypothetical protein FXW30_01850 [Candidatus Liberibacter asiaticus]|nr:hypothetical protein FXW22_03450 [Candidatus Liberibacter asiaticus]KAE9510752.1 hypothetical protein FXW31_05020 [Candidatus Liberibacter asiaticus]KAE9512141.1 hypothetical protein FXW32_03465 [Candidatus Liberibacter asiaticus]KAE9513193.1 hypothetical protein FXW35_03530 [Candidatus Liberibacter asiaticus]KAE9514274.1 hypothetical protein FXW25_03365 [Candidatus Liberibacter asiaticus]